MTDRPILFSEPMVRALLAGRKTQTRRVLKIVGHKAFSAFGPSDTNGYDWHFRDARLLWHDLRHSELNKRLSHHVGDRLWVREAWRCEGRFDAFKPQELKPCPIYYSADPDPRDSEPGCAGRFRPSMFMPRWASRLTLIVTDVRVQRVQDISEADSMAEGCPTQTNDQLAGMEARGWFRDLWDSLNADRGFGWDANPWVSATTFTVHHVNIDCLEPPDDQA